MIPSWRVAFWPALCILWPLLAARGQTQQAPVGQPAPAAFQALPHPTPVPRTSRITGTVVDEAGKPVSGIILRAVLAPDDVFRLAFPRSDLNAVKNAHSWGYSGPSVEDIVGRSATDALAETNEYGAYSFDHLPAAHYFLTGYGKVLQGNSLETDAVIVPVEVETQEFGPPATATLLVRHGTLMEGQVVAQDSGKPISGVPLYYLDPTHPLAVQRNMPYIPYLPSDFPSPEVKTDAQGRFRLWTTPGEATFSFANKSGGFVRAADVVMTSHQKQLWPTDERGYKEGRYVKSGGEFYLNNFAATVSEDGAPAHTLALYQKTTVQVTEGRTKKLVFHLERLTFKPGKTPTKTYE